MEKEHLQHLPALENAITIFSGQNGVLVMSIRKHISLKQRCPKQGLWAKVEPWWPLIGINMPLKHIFISNISFCYVLLIKHYIHNAQHTAVSCYHGYIVICNPLRLTQICTVSKMYILESLIWVLSAIQDLLNLFILLATKPLAFFYTSIPCQRLCLISHL